MSRDWRLKPPGRKFKVHAVQHVDPQIVPDSLGLARTEFIRVLVYLVPRSQENLDPEPVLSADFEYRVDQLTEASTDVDKEKRIHGVGFDVLCAVRRILKGR